jgi:hypothetical protein
MTKKRNKKYNPNKAKDSKLQIFEITPTQYWLNLLADYVKRGYLTCHPIQQKGLAEFNHEYHLMVYLLQHLFFLQLCKRGDNKVRKYFISIRDSIVRYLDRIANYSVYDEESDIVILPASVEVSPILAGKITFVVKNNFKLMTNLTQAEHFDLMTTANDMFAIWAGSNLDSSVHLLLDYQDTIKNNKEAKESLKCRKRLY